MWLLGVVSRKWVWVESMVVAVRGFLILLIPTPLVILYLFFFCSNVCVRDCVCLHACVRACVCLRSFLPPRASRSRNIGS